MRENIQHCNVIFPGEEDQLKQAAAPVTVSGSPSAPAALLPQGESSKALFAPEGNASLRF